MIVECVTVCCTNEDVMYWEVERGIESKSIQYKAPPILPKGAAAHAQECQVSVSVVCHGETIIVRMDNLPTLGPWPGFKLKCRAEDPSSRQSMNGPVPLYLGGHHERQ
ncbi:hypothetical protein E2C01_046171 [Portunus trituberculatus]|uniref:Uncharacterized protein n=1 Tax=Portunus trituberculatus TaxID=210409 RepID=A0A5B7G3Y8_PORTR|nr:hypothetical protein [Portunus trituberculatus]